MTQKELEKLRDRIARYYRDIRPVDELISSEEAVALFHQQQENHISRDHAEEQWYELFDRLYEDELDEPLMIV